MPKKQQTCRLSVKEILEIARKKTAACEKRNTQKKLKKNIGDENYKYIEAKKRQKRRISDSLINTLPITDTDDSKQIDPFMYFDVEEDIEGMNQKEYKNEDVNTSMKAIRETLGSIQTRGSYTVVMTPDSRDDQKIFGVPELPRKQSLVGTNVFSEVPALKEMITLANTKNEKNINAIKIFVTAEVFANYQNEEGDQLNEDTLKSWEDRFCSYGCTHLVKPQKAEKLEKQLGGTLIFWQVNEEYAICVLFKSSQSHNHLYFLSGACFVRSFIL